MFGGDILLMKYALIDNATNRVTNIIVLDDLDAWTVPDDAYLVLVETQVQMGDVYRGGVFDGQDRRDVEAAERSAEMAIEALCTSALAKLNLTAEESAALGLG